MKRPLPLFFPISFFLSSASNLLPLQECGLHQASCRGMCQTVEMQSISILALNKASLSYNVWTLTAMLSLRICLPFH